MKMLAIMNTYLKRLAGAQGESFRRVRERKTAKHPQLFPSVLSFLLSLCPSWLQERRHLWCASPAAAVIALGNHSPNVVQKLTALWPPV